MTMPDSVEYMEPAAFDAYAAKLSHAASVVELRQAQAAAAKAWLSFVCATSSERPIRLEEYEALAVTRDETLRWHLRACAEIERDLK